MTHSPDLSFSFLKNLDIPPAWETAAEKFLATGAATLVLGGPDTGKSTLCKYLIYRAYAAGEVSALIDLDLGQSHLGPPGALGLGLFPPRQPGDQGLFPEGLYFIGQTSPVGAVLEVAVGCRTLADQALAKGVSRLVVNTSGLITGPAAYRLKQAEVELLKPALVLALAREEELAPLLRVLEGDAPILRLPVSPLAVRRGMEERRHYRQDRFRRYFAKAQALEFSLTDITWWGPPFGWGKPLAPEDLHRWSGLLGFEVLYGTAGDPSFALLVEDTPMRPLRSDLPEGIRLFSRSSVEYSLTGLWDRSRRTLALGVLLPSDWRDSRLRVWTPLSPARASEVRFLTLGRLRLSSTGRELPLSEAVR